MACVAASLGVLVSSDGERTDLWDVQPAVFLSISETVCSNLLRYAFATAVPISWWRHAIQGSSLARLEKEWEAGSSFFGALLSGRYFRHIAFASVCVVLLLATGPFLQQASVAVQAVPQAPVSLTFQLSPQVPTNWSGERDRTGNNPSAQINTAYYNFVQKTPIELPVEGCEDVCTARVRAPGLFKSSCAASKVSVDTNNLDAYPVIDKGSYTLLRTDMDLNNVNETWYGFDAFPKPNPLPIPDPNRESITVYSRTARLEEGKGELTLTQCWLVSAIIEHAVSVRNSSIVTFLNSPADGTMIALSNNAVPFTPAMDDPTHNLTIGNIINIADSVFETDLVFESNNGLSTFGRTVFVDQVAALDFSKPDFIENFKSPDPMPVIMAGLNEIFFRGGIIAASSNLSDFTASQIDPGLSVLQHVQGNVTSTVSVFQSRYRWWSGAAVIQVLCILAIAPLFWKWWTLGRQVTLSPFEIAKALEAPLLRDVHSNAGATGILQEKGETRLRYGSTKNPEGDYDGRAFSGTTVSHLVLRPELNVDPILRS